MASNANALTTFQPGAVPAHIAAFTEELGDNTTGGGITVPSLSPQGKVWTVSLDGQKTKLEKRDSDGELVPVSVMRVVILDFNKERGRAYYEGAYDPAKESAPVCWSDNGVTPDASVTNKQAPKCADCPQAIKGSRVTDQGKPTTACSQHRMLALVPAHKLDFEPLRLKIAMTSDWDKESPQAAKNAQQGWFAFQNFRDHIKTMGVPHTAMIVTKMKFDPDAAYPKILFAVDRWLTSEELAEIVPVAKGEKVQQLLAGTWTPAGPDGTRKDDTTAGAGEGVAATPQQEATEAAAQVPAQSSDDDDDGPIMGLDAPAETKTQAPAQAETPVAAAKLAKTKAPAEAQPAVVTAKDPALADLLKDWG
jgi:hypothetical protein